ncbi:hypothetical protein HNY73_015020 [Argiope bruennichi]|uniref:Uncharacterized protein n=1 Tax=Argiope bruennichi TaxID=94029 RepID=A0A8T0EVF8_ARGBR|nr:hypothetical protein HNY73_015020 [Argiope bruennichi]
MYGSSADMRKVRTAEAEYVTVSLRCQDVTSVLLHFGDDLPLMFIFTTTNFGENVRAALHLNSSEECYFDPVSTNEKIGKITILIDSMTDEQRNFLRHCFPGDQKVTEIDQAEANKILDRTERELLRFCILKPAHPMGTRPTNFLNSLKIDQMASFYDLKANFRFKLSNYFNSWKVDQEKSHMLFYKLNLSDCPTITGSIKITEYLEVEVFIRGKKIEDSYIESFVGSDCILKYWQQLENLLNFFRFRHYLLTSTATISTYQRHSVTSMSV